MQRMIPPHVIIDTLTPAPLDKIYSSTCRPLWDTPNGAEEIVGRDVAERDAVTGFIVHPHRSMQIVADTTRAAREILGNRLIIGAAYHR